MEEPVRKAIAYTAMAAPGLHTLTDLLEWVSGGFSTVQLWLNYAAFLPVPVLVVGLYAAQRPRIAYVGLIGALLYGFAFVYFAHTTLFALAQHISTYDQLWSELGWSYTAHGALMIIGGAAFGWATDRAQVFPRWISSLFLLGVGINLVLALLPLPDLLQTVGTALRNAGLAAMGWTLLRTPSASLSRDPRTGAL